MHLPGAVLSGYHLLLPNCKDGSTHIDKIRRTIKQVESWKDENPDSSIHLEMGDNKYEETYASTLRLLSPFIDSMGLNENELGKVSSSLGISTPNSQGTLNARRAYEAARKI